MEHLILQGVRRKEDSWQNSEGPELFQICSSLPSPEKQEENILKKVINFMQVFC